MRDSVSAELEPFYRELLSSYLPAGGNPDHNLFLIEFTLEPVAVVFPPRVIHLVHHKLDYDDAVALDC